VDESPTPHGDPAPQCSTGDCGRTDLIKSAGLCRRCYQLVRAGRDPAKPLRNRRHGELCTHPGCEEKQRCRDLCQAHYDLERRSGKIGTRKPEKPRHTEDEARELRIAFLWANIDKRGPDECWPWKRKLRAGGHGQLRWMTSQIGAHVAVYEVTYGEVPEDPDRPGRKLEVDHLCHDPAACSLKTKCPHRACCNPAHLEAVPGVVNRRRGDASRPGNGGKIGSGCKPGCTCDRHRDSTCDPGCTCGRHRSSACKPGCTCGRHHGSGGLKCQPGCTCGRHRRTAA
jgi:hypothetical protein